MLEQWVRKKVLITVRTYPSPSKKVIEASCTAGICDGEWIRLFPVPYRLLDNDKRFRKYQYIEVNTKTSSDTRPESFKIDVTSINILTPDPINTDNKWQARKNLVLPLKSKSLCWLYRQRVATGIPTLGIFKPLTIRGLEIKKSRTEWTVSQKESLLQNPLFGTPPKTHLMKLPVDFFYLFKCDDPDCMGHRLSCTDWEVGESYLKWKDEYGDDWEKKFRERYEYEMINKFDTHFYVGTVHGHPLEWIIIGLFYPPKTSEAATQAMLL